ncbi:MAG: dTMP kinase [Vicinamibacterales bacterium]|nr:dTMP kinase [Vicinamibacterales bacterium]
MTPAIPGLLVAIEGLDQSGKETQAHLLGPWFDHQGVRVELIGFPDYSTTIGAEIGEALRGRRQFSAEVMQLLYVANRHEWKQAIDTWTGEGRAVICDRYLASSVAYGEAQGLDPAWLTLIQATLPQPVVTVLLDIAPAAAAARKRENRDRFEQDLDMLGRVRMSYLRQAAEQDWIVVDADRHQDAVAFDIIGQLGPRLVRS